MGLADPPDPLRGQLPGQRVALDDDVVVAERLPLLEPHRRPGYPRSEQPRRSRAATSASSRPRAVDRRDVLHPPHPGELAAGEAPLGALHRLDVAARAARRSRSPPARCARRRRASALRTSSSAPRRTISSTRASIRARSSSRSIVSPTSGVGTRRPLAPEPLRRSGGRRSRAARARSGGRSACGRSGARPRRAPARARREAPPGRARSRSASTSARTSEGTGGRSSSSESAARM